LIIKVILLNNFLVIIPTYNEIDNIEKVICLILNLNDNIDILIVDDNSPDGTSVLVKSLIEKNNRVNLLERKSKLGLGSAYILGFKWALVKKYAFVIQMDADLSHNPNDINEFIKESDCYDLIIGSRYINGISIVNWPLSRLILSYFANLYARVIIGVPIKDLTGGFKCISSNVLNSINLDDIKSEGYSFQIELNFLAWNNNFKIKEIPIIFTDRAHGNSKMSKFVIFEAIYMVPYLFFKKIFNF